MLGLASSELGFAASPALTRGLGRGGIEWRAADIGGWVAIDGPLYSPAVDSWPKGEYDALAGPE